MNVAYLILGSNIVPEKNLPEALHLLSSHPEISIQRKSSFWKTEPVGSTEEDFLNIAIQLHTSLDFKELKQEVLRGIEQKLGRVRHPDKNAPRIIDLDIVIFNDQVIEPDLFKLEYLYLPFAELIPEFKSVELGKTLRDLANSVAKTTTSRKCDTRLEC